tara:strand:- start:2867 stop:3784 length:918 start_codon:yes stop_codon:yes gene_type:complete
MSEDFKPSKHEWGTDEGRKWAEDMTPGQKVDQIIKEAQNGQSDYTAKTFSKIIGNPLQGYPHNEEFTVEGSEVEESRYTDERDKRQKATLKKHDKRMIKVARDSIKKYDAKNKNKNETVAIEANTMGNVKKALSKVKGLTSDQLKTLMTIPQSQLMVIAQQLSGLVMGEEIHESQIEQHLPKLDEVMSMQTRLKMKKAFRKNKHKIAIGRKRAAKKVNLNPEKIQKRANKAARSALEKKFLKGTNKNDLGHAGKAALEKKINSKASVIKRIAIKMKKIIRKKEATKLKDTKKIWDKASKDLKGKK